MNVNQIIENYLESLRVRHFEALTVVGRHAVLRDFAGWLETAGVTDWREVTRHTVADYVRHLLRRLAANTVRTYQVCLRDFFAHLENTDVDPAQSGRGRAVCPGRKSPAQAHPDAGRGPQADRRAGLEHAHRPARPGHL